MRSFLWISFTLLSACATMGNNPAKNPSLSSFEAVQLGSASTTLENEWGKPQVTGDYSIEGVQFTQWEYRNSNRLGAWFLIDQNKNGTVVEKVFFPIPRTQESDINYLTNEKFKSVKFEKIGAKCAHFGEFVYRNKPLGLFIMSSDVGTNIPVAAIAMDTPDLVDLRSKEEQNRRCWH